MQEVNFDGLVGPTHNYAGLSFGNLASMHHAHQISNPKEAALQGLNKMKRLMDRGMVQAVLPPQERPSIRQLRALGFRGTDTEIIEKAAKTAPELLTIVSSASAMWRANSATVTPSCDSRDGKVHLTIANLKTDIHRSLEAKETERLFRFLFDDPTCFVIHPPLFFADEGAANHMRFCKTFAEPGVHLYVYGKEALTQEPHLFPARQTREASEAIARLHGGKALFAKQNPAIIEKGVFHNDVIACGNKDLLLYHEEAFVNSEEILSSLEFVKKIKVDISIDQAVESYLFNSQLLTLPDQTQLLLAPEECRSLDLSWLPFPVEFVNLHESMQNGGGPACLRLAIPLSNEEIDKIHPAIFLNNQLYETLAAWVEKHYRDHLHPNDLGDPHLWLEVQAALDELSSILQLGSFYDFQKAGAGARR